MKNNVLVIALPLGMDPVDVYSELSATGIRISSPVIQLDSAYGTVFSSVASNVAKEESDETRDEEQTSGAAICSGSTHDTGYDRVQLWLEIYRNAYTNSSYDSLFRSGEAEKAANLAVEAFDRKFS